MSAIAYQGEPGSNSHIACTEVFPGWEALPCASFEDAFAEVVTGRAQRAMIPIENSLAGRVADIHLLLPETHLRIVGEHFLRIRFDLLGVPGSRLEDVREAHSHVHALGQCRGFLREHRLSPVIAGDTAGSARAVARWADPARASLAPPPCAQLYGLQVLASGVEDDPTNTTRFVVLADAPEPPAREDLPGQVLTTLVFQVRNVPSALYKALGGFATNGTNMTRLESYMVGAGFAATQFLVDVEGHPSDPPLARALAELEFFTTDVRVLGVYPAHPFRSTVRGAAGVWPGRWPPGRRWCSCGSGTGSWSR
ncbi:prephenate dehydratase [Kineococcus glutinatus]|uniref:prephenate dehydratase n=1 Tax=Kineococcus glutinatus TaxID=1070872 RepID=UPI0031EBFD18